jgi:O-acetyl-ADP-ribose deacetylase (regulator of RNase III)
MSIDKRNGDLLGVTKGHIVHGCNSHGVMGSGVALAIKEKYPECFATYRKFYEEHGLKLGSVVPFVVNDDLVIWNAITQANFGRNGERYVSYDAVAESLAQINLGITIFTNIPAELNFPLIGAGLGGGRWPIIEAIIDDTVECKKILWIK